MQSISSDSLEQSLVLLKPDCYVRGLLGTVTTRFEERGLLLVASKVLVASPDLLRSHYGHLADRPFYPRVAEFMQSAPIVAQVWAGLDAVRVIREMAGPTNGRDAASGTIRGDFAMSVQSNVIHASDSVDAGADEIARFFPEGVSIAVPKWLIQLRYSVDEIAT